MHDSTPRRHDSEILKCILAPFQKLKPLVVPLKLYFFVLKISVLFPGHIRLYAVINDQIDWNLGVDLIWIFA
jgi:hypothetical protein